MTTNQDNHSKMLKKMNPELWDRFGNQIHLNQKFHPNMTGQYMYTGREAKTPNNMTRKQEYISLQGPVQPKPPAFFDQAYQGKPDWRKKASLSQTRPYSAYNAHDDAQSYMSHQKLKRKQNHQKTLDPSKAMIRSRRLKNRSKKRQDEDEEEWERFNEKVSYKSGVSQRSSKFSNRLHSANRNARPGKYLGLRDRMSNAKAASELTQQNLKDFEERLSSQAGASRRKDKIIFSDKDKQVKDYEENKEGEGDKEQEPLNQEDPDQEGEGDADAEKEEAENEELMSIKSKSEVQTMSKASRKSYVLSLRKQLQKERDERRKLEEQVKEMIESKRATSQE
uniref:Uncharacterized protein n=1 Tax=Euplotes crassus TaxID=5936 RepID=A0A7S3KCC6_EUPCR